MKSPSSRNEHVLCGCEPRGGQPTVQQRVARAHDDTQMVRPDDLRADFRARGHGTSELQIHLALSQLSGVDGRLGDESQAHARRSSDHRSQKTGRNHPEKQVVALDGECPIQRAQVQFGFGREDRRRRPDEFMRTRTDGRSVGRRCHGAPRPNQDLISCDLAETAQASTDGGLRQMKTLCGTHHAALFEKRIQHGQKVKVQLHICNDVIASIAFAACAGDAYREVMASSDLKLLPDVVSAVEAAAAHMMARFSTSSVPATREEVVRHIEAGDGESLSVLRPLLQAAHPPAGWVDDELDDGALPAGEWWVTDPVEGAINYVHGIGEWAVTATLVRDNEAVLTVVVLPLEAATYTAVRGHGAYLNGTALTVSSKVDLAASLVGTGQASPRETSETFRLIARTLPAMMAAAMVTRVSVPPTLQLVHVAAGRMDVFWQHSAVRSGLLPGALVVQEAGGTVTDLHGEPWSLKSTDFLAAAPGVHDPAVHILANAL